MGLPITPFNPPQSDPIGAFGRLLEIKNAQQEFKVRQQQQTENDLKIQQQKMAVEQQAQAQKDSQLLTAAHQQAGGDIPKFLELARQSGASESAITAAQTNIEKAINLAATSDENKRKQATQQLAMMGDALTAVNSAKPEDQPAIWEAEHQKLASSGLFDAQHLAPFQQYPGPGQVRQLTAAYTTQDQIQKAADTRKANADAALAEAKAKAAAIAADPAQAKQVIDGIADPKKYPELNKRLTFQMGFAQRNIANDPEGPAKVIAAGMQDIATTERETNPDVLKARTAQAVATKNAEQEANAPALKDLVKTTSAGRQYLTAEDVKGQSESYLRKQASQQGIPVVDKDTDQMLSDLDTARANQQSMLDMVSGKLAQSPSERIYKGPENKLESAMQTDPTLAAMGTFRNAAIQSMRAVAGSKGLRINRQEIQLAIDNDIPKMTDTWAVAQAKVKALGQFMDNAEAAHLTRNRSNGAPSQAAAPVRIRVKLSDGRTGTIDQKDFNASTMTKIQ